jgi:hypothetical protein
MDEIATLVRAAKRARQLPRNAHCVYCGERSIWALTKKGQRVLCYACSVRPYERQHVIGRNNSAVTVSIPANAHRTLSDYQHDWPAGALRNPTAEPTVARRAASLSRADVIQLALAHHLEHDDPVYNALLDGVRRAWDGEPASDSGVER